MVCDNDEKVVVFRSNERQLRALSKLAQAVRQAEEANRALEEVLNDIAVKEIGEKVEESKKKSPSAVLAVEALDLIGDVLDYDSDRGGKCHECLCEPPNHDELCPWHWLREFHDRYREPR